MITRVIQEQGRDGTSPLCSGKKYVGTDEYIEEVAREKLGLVGPNERVYIDANSTN